MSFETLQPDVEGLVLALCEDLATPVSLGVYLRIKNRCWDDLALMRVDPKHYNEAESYFKDACSVEFLRKYKGLPTSFDRKAAAVDNFWKSEKECYSTNERLHPYIEGFSHPEYVPALGDFLRQVRKNVAALLGPCPSGLLEGRFGPGATFGDKGRLTTIPDKMSSRPTVTSGALYFSVFDWKSTAWASTCATRFIETQVVRGNRFTTVPKDSTKDRGIAVEPSVNLFYQLSFGKVMKKRLKHAGLNLQDGQAIHRQVACEASKEGSFATIDLSNASDTVSTNLVRLVLPHQWFDALSALRSPYTLLDGKWVKLEKFSSMGNGYTFELETAIFAAISMAVMQTLGTTPFPGVNLFVYGDDIIVPNSVAPCVLSALRYLGFTPNGKKTFLNGPFKESCGGDYFNGVDVRPFQLEDTPLEPQHFIAMANGIRAMGRKNPGSHASRSYLLRSWFRVLDALPTHIRRLRGPEGLGDIVIHDEQERWQIRWKHSIRYIRCYRPISFRRIGWQHWHPDVVLATALYGLSDTVSGPIGNRRSLGVTPRDAVTGHGVAWVPFS